MNVLQEYQKNIKQSLGKTEHPYYKKDLMTLEMFDRLEEYSKDKSRLCLFLKTPDKEKASQIQLEAEIRKGFAKIKIPSKLVIKFTYDENIQKKHIPAQVTQKTKHLPNVKHLIAVGSGKGGVGKSTVAANLAVSLARLKKKTGLIDADIYGPSLGKMFGVDGRLPLGGDGKNLIYPHESHGIKLISFSFLLNGDQAVVWRGPMLGKAIEQFLFQVLWGQLDYLILDLPPGTGDVQLSMAQLTEVDGAIIVTTPQNVALQDARRAAHMFRGVNIPILGVVENMAAFHCPECNHISHIFSKNGGQNLASDLGIPLLSSLPLQKEVMEASEAGSPITLSTKDSDQTIIKDYDKLTNAIVTKMEG